MRRESLENITTSNYGVILNRQANNRKQYTVCMKDFLILVAILASDVSIIPLLVLVLVYYYYVCIDFTKSIHMM